MAPSLFCSICIESSEHLSRFALCPCGHAFHYKCIIEWAESRNSQEQSPTCPTCNADFEDVPAKGIVKKLFFSFDGDASGKVQPVAPQSRKRKTNARLTAELAERDAQIDSLRSELDVVKEQQRQTNAEIACDAAKCQLLQTQLDDARNAARRVKDEAEKMVSSIERRCKELTKDMKRVSAHLAKEEDRSDRRGESSTERKARVDCFKWQIAGMVVHLRDSNADLLSLNELLRQMETSRPAAASSPDDDSLTEPMQVRVSNLGCKVEERDIWELFRDLNPKYVAVFKDYEDRPGADVIFTRPQDAQNALSFDSDANLFGKEIKVRYAIGEEEKIFRKDVKRYRPFKEVLRGQRHLFISSIQKGAKERDLERFVGIKPNSVGEIYRDSRGVSLQTALVKCRDYREARKILEEFDDRYFQGRRLDIIVAKV